MKVGFTGTREGMTEDQKETLYKLLLDPLPDEFHHGDCVGADEEAAEIASELGIQVVAHPPDDSKLRAYYEHNDKTLVPIPYLVRNMNIVDEVEWLIAAPKNRVDKRGGTWYTIRYAKGNLIDNTIIWPDGSTTHEFTQRDN